MIVNKFGGNKDVIITDSLKQAFKQTPSKTLLITTNEDKKKCLNKELSNFSHTNLGSFELDKTGNSFKPHKQDKKKVKYGNDNVNRVFGYQEDLKSRFNKKYDMRKIDKNQLKEILIKCNIQDYDTDCGKINYDSNKIDYSTDMIECVRKLPKPKPPRVPNIKVSPKAINNQKTPKINSQPNTPKAINNQKPPKINSQPNTPKTSPIPKNTLKNNSSLKKNNNLDLDNSSPDKRTRRNNLKNRETVSYIISVKTSSDKSGSTDSKISVVLNGESGSSSELKLERSSTNKNKFEKGKTDIFTFTNIKNLGNIISIKVSSNSGKGMTHLFSPDWKVENIKVESSIGDLFSFNTDQWFSKKQGLEHTFTLDGKKISNIRENSNTKKNKISINNVSKLSRKNSKSKITYTIKVKTSEDKNSGTDSNISINLLGTYGNQKFKLKNSKNNWNKFEKGAVDEFEFKNQNDLGNITKILVEKDKSRGLKLMSPDWKLEYVKINTSDGRSYTFNCNQKFNKESGISHEFTLSTSAKSNKANSNKNNLVKTKKNNSKMINRDVSKKKNESNKIEYTNKKNNLNKKTSYTVKVETAKDKKSGTDADIKLVIHGSKNSKEFELSKSKTNRNKFERGKTDIFEFEDVNDLGIIEKITVSSDGSRGLKLFNPQWKLRKIKIENDKGGKYYFSANKWFNKENGTEHEFTSKETNNLNNNKNNNNKNNNKNNNNSNKKPEKVPSYKITVQTSNEQYSGTDNDITLLMHGSAGSSEIIELEKSKTNKNKFEKGNTDVFELFDIKDLGNVNKISLSWGGRSILKLNHPEWKPLKVKIENSKGNEFHFFANKWFGKREGKTHSFMAKSKEDVDKMVDKVSENLETKPYLVTIETSNDKNSGTDSNITLVIHGSDDTTGALKLSKSKTNRNKFEEGQTDIFEFSNINKLGDINKITLSSDTSKGLKFRNPEWKPVRIKIENEKGKEFHFFINKWFNKDESSHDMYPENKDEVDRKVGSS